ncbi:unnamed protein product [Pieris macdunnoughi]|uniref:Uncharacterized protein n=1 Tax=Pieris macdunnoughi TaxID=345717 RepID=A0A821M2A3_9NEOP|nr:unnamed protein product [Pieris macdunnoughi]
MFSRVGLSEVFVFVFFECVLARSLHNSTTCELFERDASFDPHEVVDSKWKIFYFWSDNTERNAIVFSLLTKKSLGKFREVVEAIEPSLSVEWHKASFLMEPRPGVQVLLLYAGTSGAFRGLVKMEQRKKARPNPEPLIKFADLRLKMKGRYIGMMCCEDLTAFAMARVGELPETEEDCIAAAASLDLQGPGGRSHLFLNNLRRSEL